MYFLDWLWSKSSAEKLLAKAFIHFEKGDKKTAFSNLLDGLIDLAGPGKVATDISTIKADAIKYGIAAAPVIAAAPAPPAPPTPPTTPAVAAAGS